MVIKMKKQMKKRSLIKSFLVFTLALGFTAAIAASLFTAEGAGRVTSGGEAPPTAGIFLRKAQAQQNFAEALTGKDENSVHGLENLKFLLPAPLGGIVGLAAQAMAFAEDISEL